MDGISRDGIRIRYITLTPLSYTDPKQDLWRSYSYTVWKTDAALTQVYTDQGIIDDVEKKFPYSPGSFKSPNPKMQI